MLATGRHGHIMPRPHLESRTTSQNVRSCYSWPWADQAASRIASRIALDQMIQSGPPKWMEPWLSPSDCHRIPEGFKHRIRLHDLVLQRHKGRIHRESWCQHKYVSSQSHSEWGVPFVFQPIHWSKEPRAKIPWVKAIVTPCQAEVVSHLRRGHLADALAPPVWGKRVCFVRLGLARIPMLVAKNTRKNMDIVHNMRNEWLLVWMVCAFESSTCWNQKYEESRRVMSFTAFPT